MSSRIINEATALGYAVMRLDTLDTLDPAMRLYRELGFQRCAPYDANPLPGVVYWERALSKPAPAILTGSEHRSDHAGGVGL